MLQAIDSSYENCLGFLKVSCTNAAIRYQDIYVDDFVETTSRPTNVHYKRYCIDEYALLLEQAQRTNDSRVEYAERDWSHNPSIPKMSPLRQRNVSVTSALSSTNATNQPTSYNINFTEEWKSRVHMDTLGNNVDFSTDPLIPNIPSQNNLSRMNATPVNHTCRTAKRKFRKLVAQGISQEEASKLSLMSWQAIFEMFPALRPEALQQQPEEPQIPANTAQEHTNENENTRNCLSKTDGQGEISNNTEVTKQQFSSNNTSPFRIGIRNSEPMNGTQMKMIHRHLILSIMEQFTDGSGPEFLSFTHKSGSILVTCVNKYSSDWLAQEVQYLEPWPGAKISVIPERELPSPPMVVALIPQSEASLVQEALDLIKVQNQGLNTEHWQILHERVEKSKNIIVTFIIDEPSLETLLAQNCEVALGFKMVTFKIKYAGSQTIRPPDWELEQTRVQVWIPGEPDTEYEKEFLYAQNPECPELRILEWRLVNREALELGTRLTFVVPEEMEKIWGEKTKTLYFSATSVRVWILRNNIRGQPNSVK